MATKQLLSKLKLPVVCAPMFLVSGPQLVSEACKAGVLGTFPALNQRTTEGYEEWLLQINSSIAAYEQETGDTAAPYGVNLIVHRSNPRLQADLEMTVKHKVPVVITSLGAVQDVVDAVHSYGGLVFHDVISVRHAEKAAQAGVDGVIAVCAGAGGHAGLLSPFALVPEIRKNFDGSILLSGCMNRGSDVAAALALGADFAYMGTRFINTQESLAKQEYKEMIKSSTAKDIVYTPAISGVAANFMLPSLQKAGVDPNALKQDIDFGEELDASKAWKDIWSAGQGVGGIDDIPTVAELVGRMKSEYAEATQSLANWQSSKL